MGFFTPQSETVDLGDGNTITVKKLSWGESLELLSQSTRPDGSIDWPIYTLRRAVMAVTAWRGQGFEGREINEENIKLLPQRVGKALSQAIEHLNSDIGEEEGNE